MHTEHFPVSQQRYVGTGVQGEPVLELLEACFLGLEHDPVGYGVADAELPTIL